MINVSKSEFLKLYNRGLSDQEMADILHCHLTQVIHTRSKKYSLRSNVNSVEHDRLYLYNRGHTDAEIAKEMHYSEIAIRKWRERRGLGSNVGKGNMK